MTPYRLLLAYVTAGFIAAPAYAQWSGSLGVGLRNFSFTEVDQQGGRLVRERGVLPAVYGGAAFKSGRLRLTTTADIAGNSITYDGRSQLGQPVTSTTNEYMTLIGAGAEFAIDDTWSVAASAEHRRWRRAINGVGPLLGLQEHSKITQLVAGVIAQLPGTDIGTLSIGAKGVFASPERIRVNFSGALDAVSLRTRSASGIRLNVGYRPSQSSPINIEAQYDRMHVARSDDVGVSRNGVPFGSVAQPAHTSETFAVVLRYDF